MNTVLLRKVGQAILEHPDQFDMREYFTNEDDCDTAACIAGWTVFIADGYWNLAEASWRAENVWSRARRLLDLTEGYSRALARCDGETFRLFCLDQWPQQFSALYREAQTPIKRAESAVARIEHFLKTQGAE